MYKDNIYINDPFEILKIFTKFFPHNNYDRVLFKLRKFDKNNRKNKK